MTTSIAWAVYSMWQSSAFGLTWTNQSPQNPGGAIADQPPPIN